MLVADTEKLYLLSGDGNVLEPDDNVAAIGSGGPYALSAAKALLRNTDLDAPTIVAQAMHVAAEVCIYTNDKLTIEQLP